MKPLFSLMPVGGVGEIGSNHTLIRAGNTDIIIDCGILFPHEDAFDINYLIPDFSYIDSGRLKALIITHGHEDHIGALAHFIELHPDIPIYASRFTQQLIIRKCEEHGVRPKLIEYSSNDVLQFGDITIHPIHVTHSIPETFGLFLHDPSRVWGAFYVSDFKYDRNPVSEKPFDIEKLARLAATCEKVAFFMDSTNALVPGHTPSERELIPELEQIVASDVDRLFLTLFSSNVHRMGTLFALAKKHQRRIVLMGRSMENYARAGVEAGIIPMTMDDFSLPAQVKGQAGRMLILLSGCQGDFLSALRRVSAGEDGTFKLTASDTVVFSSKVIPGNERKIARIINDITESGARVITAYDSLIHASGHPAKEDLAQIVEHVRPHAYFPIHGESYFLRRHTDFIRDRFPGIFTEMIMNFTAVSFYTTGNFKLEQHDILEPILIHGKGLPIERSQISQRRKLATQGTVFASIDRVRGECVISSLGLPLSAQDCLPKVRKLILDRVRSDLGGRAPDYASDQLRILVRQYFQQSLGYKPVTEVHLLS